MAKLFKWTNVKYGVCLFLLVGLTQCGQKPEVSKPMPVQIAAAVDDFVMRYQNRAATQNSEIPLQMFIRVGPSSDDSVCTTGELYGPYTVTGGVVDGESSITLSQPTLRLANLGDLDICTIITAPVDAELNVSADTLYLQSEECDQTPENIEGVWEGNYSCTSTCGDTGGHVSLTIVQDEFSASYTDGYASYEGTVCGNTFKFSGGGPGYTERGTFTLNDDGTASKTSSYQETDNSCSGTCSDPVLTRQTPNVLVDDFDDAALDPEWTLSADNTNNNENGWTFQETGTILVVSDVDPAQIHDSDDRNWSKLRLYRNFSPLNDFNVEFKFSWESADDSAMQTVSVQLYSAEGGPRIAQVGYYDAWVGSSGQQLAIIGASTYASSGGSMPNNGNASVRIIREDGQVRVLWNGVNIHEGTHTNALGDIYIEFGHYPYDNGAGVTSSFGTESVDRISINGTPAL